MVWRLSPCACASWLCAAASCACRGMAKGVEKATALLRHLAFLGTSPLGRECWGKASLSISGLCCRDLPLAHCRQLTLPCPPSLSPQLPLNLQNSSSQQLLPAGPPWCFSSPSCSAAAPSANGHWGTDTAGSATTAMAAAAHWCWLWFSSPDWRAPAHVFCGLTVLRSVYRKWTRRYFEQLQKLRHSCLIPDEEWTNYTLSFPARRRNIRIAEIQLFHEEESQPSRQRSAALMGTEQNVQD